MTEFTQKIVDAIKSIPEGYVASYGMVAMLAGNPRGARQVARILHTLTQKEQLPWHRVVNSKGMISLPPGRGYEEQRAILETEGITFTEKGTIPQKYFFSMG